MYELGKTVIKHVPISCKSELVIYEGEVIPFSKDNWKFYF